MLDQEVGRKWGPNDLGLLSQLSRHWVQTKEQGGRRDRTGEKGERKRAELTEHKEKEGKKEAGAGTQGELPLESVDAREGATLRNPGGGLGQTKEGVGQAAIRRSARK